MNTTQQWSFFLFVFSFLVVSCQPATEEGKDDVSQGQAIEVSQTSVDMAKGLVMQAIKIHGGSLYDSARIEFDFRGRHYVSDRKGGNYQYERVFEEKGKAVRDILSNEGFKRYIDGEETTLSNKKSKSYSNSVNSVIYFALLPYFLNDPAVNMQYLGEVDFNNGKYQKVKVTFKQEGGGKDFEDEYIYWINTTSFTVDYLAYNYLVDGGGARMREAYNIRTVNGIRFADYINYKPTNGSRDVATFDELYEAGKMKELSKIESENIIVSR